ncbi:Hypothetical predicted protein, partial [Olea europaea subsp. europaea]
GARPAASRYQPPPTGHNPVPTRGGGVSRARGVRVPLAHTFASARDERQTSLLLCHIAIRRRGEWRRRPGGRRRRSRSSENGLSSSSSSHQPVGRRDASALARLGSSVEGEPSVTSAPSHTHTGARGGAHLAHTNRATGEPFVLCAGATTATGQVGGAFWFLRYCSRQPEAAATMTREYRSMISRCALVCWCLTDEWQC